MYGGLCDRLQDSISVIRHRIAQGDIQAKALLDRYDADTHQFMAYAIHFAYELAYPSNHVVEVKPTKQGKSVQWLAARKHFVLLPTKAIQAMQVPGNRTSRNEVRDIIQRCAHERRGHSRRLKAERYSKNEDGTLRPRREDGSYVTVWVRDTWVGPEEWRDTENHYTIYKFQTPCTSTKQPAVSG